MMVHVPCFLMLIHVAVFSFQIPMHATGLMKICEVFGSCAPDAFN